MTMVMRGPVGIHKPLDVCAQTPDCKPEVARGVEVDMICLTALQWHLAGFNCAIVLVAKRMSGQLTMVGQSTLPIPSRYGARIGDTGASANKTTMPGSMGVWTSFEVVSPNLRVIASM